MKIKNKFIPLQQGSLELFCGIYSVINSLRLLKIITPCSIEKAKEAFHKIVDFLEAQDDN